MLVAIILTSNLRAINTHKLFIAHALQIEADPMTTSTAIIWATFYVTHFATIIGLAFTGMVLSAYTMATAHVRASFGLACVTGPTMTAKTLAV